MKRENQKTNHIDIETDYIPFELVDTIQPNNLESSTNIVTCEFREVTPHKLRESNAKVTRERSIEINVNYEVILHVLTYVTYAAIAAVIGYGTYVVVGAFVAWFISINWAYIISLIGRVFFALIIGVLLTFFIRELIQNRRIKRRGYSDEFKQSKSESVTINQTVIINK